MFCRKHKLGSPQVDPVSVDKADSCNCFLSARWTALVAGGDSWNSKSCQASQREGEDVYPTEKSQLKHSVLRLMLKCSSVVRKFPLLQHLHSGLSQEPLFTSLTALLEWPQCRYMSVMKGFGENVLIYSTN